MGKKKVSAKPKGEVMADAREVAAIEQYWHLAGRPKLRKPPKKYKYVEELASEKLIEKAFSTSKTYYKAGQ